MLLENEDMMTLSFDVNKGLTLRQFLKQDVFKALVKKTASLI